MHALATGQPLLRATRAAGELLGRPSPVRGLIAHVTLSAGWTTVLPAGLPARHRVAWGAGGGLAIGLLDLAVARARFRAIAGPPQLADTSRSGSWWPW